MQSAFTGAEPSPPDLDHAQLVLRSRPVLTNTFHLSAARDALRLNGHCPTVATLSGIEGFEERLRNFLSDEKQQVLVRSVALDALQIARTLRFAACIADRAGAMSADELLRKRHAVDRLLEQTETEMRRTGGDALL